MRISLFLALCTLSVSCNAQPSIPDGENQIAAAVMAAPENMREEATVLGYDADGKIVTLREGKNEIVCLADDPGRKGFNVACYHKDLEPFMARGRSLKQEGKSSKESFDIRDEEVRSGQLKMPEQPTTLHVLAGDKGRYDPTSGEVIDAFYRYVIYIPFATSESTGLPLQPRNPGDPWIMDPGTYRAHIMITPPNPAK